MCIQTLSGRVDKEARKTPKLSADMPFKGDDYYCFSQYLLDTSAAATICSGVVNKPPLSPISVSCSRFLKSSIFFYFLLDICLSCAVAHIIGVQMAAGRIETLSKVRPQSNKAAYSHAQKKAIPYPNPYPNPYPAASMKKSEKPQSYRQICRLREVTTTAIRSIS